MAQFLSLPNLAGQSRRDAAAAEGALVNVWTVNEPAEARRLAAAGVDALISDVPGTIVKALA